MGRIGRGSRGLHVPFPSVRAGRAPHARFIRRARAQRPREVGEASGFFSLFGRLQCVARSESQCLYPLDESEFPYGSTRVVVQPEKNVDSDADFF